MVEFSKGNESCMRGNRNVSPSVQAVCVTKLMRLVILPLQKLNGF